MGETDRMTAVLSDSRIVHVALEDARVPWFGTEGS
jgi:hypothetical protein